MTSIVVEPTDHTYSQAFEVLSSEIWSIWQVVKQLHSEIEELKANASSTSQS